MVPCQAPVSLLHSEVDVVEHPKAVKTAAKSSLVRKQKKKMKMMNQRRKQGKLMRRSVIISVHRAGAVLSSTQVLS